MSSEWVPLAQRERLSIPHLFAIAANQLASFCAFTPADSLIFVITDRLHFTSTQSTLVMLISSLSGIISPMVVGPLSDRTTFRWGRRRIWMIGGEIATLIGLILLAIPDKLTSSYGGQVAILVIGEILATFGANVFHPLGRALCTDVTPASQQVMISNICYVHIALAGLVANAAGAIAPMTSLKPEVVTLLVCCVVSAIAFCISIFTAKEEPIDAPQKSEENECVLFFKSLKIFDKGFWLIGLANFCFYFSTLAFTALFAIFMGKVVFGGNATGTEAEEDLYNEGVSHAQTINIIQTCVMFVFSFAVTYIINFLGIRTTYCAGAVCGFVAFFLFWFKLNKWAYIVTATLIGIYQPVLGAIPYTMCSLYGEKSAMASLQALMLIMANGGAFIAQFAVNMGLASIPWFAANQGRLIAIAVVPAAGALILGFAGITIKMAQGQTETLDNDDDDIEEKDDL